MKKSQSVTLDQSHNPTFVSPERRSGTERTDKSQLPDGFDEPFRYKVLQLKNLLEPGVGTVIRKRDVERLISEGVDVTIVNKK